VVSGAEGYRDCEWLELKDSHGGFVGLLTSSTFTIPSSVERYDVSAADVSTQVR
jgi:hypothetical protein